MSQYCMDFMVSLSAGDLGGVILLYFIGGKHDMWSNRSDHVFWFWSLRSPRCLCFRLWEIIHLYNYFLGQQYRTLLAEFELTVLYVHILVHHHVCSTFRKRVQNGQNYRHKFFRATQFFRATIQNSSVADVALFEQKELCSLFRNGQGR